MALDLTPIPLYGTVGAAVATVIAEAGLTTATLLGVIRRLGPRQLDRARLARGAATVAVMGLAIFAARFVAGALIQVGAALVSFVAASLVFQPFDRELIGLTRGAA